MYIAMHGERNIDSQNSVSTAASASSLCTVPALTVVPQYRLCQVLGLNGCIAVDPMYTCSSPTRWARLKESDMSDKYSCRGSRAGYDIQCW